MPEYGEGREFIEKRYELPEENIIELDENSDFLKKLPEALRNLPWPSELQGAGHTLTSEKKFKIWYPKGDVLLSMAVIIHELGHLRQGEIDEYLDPERKRGSILENYQTNLARERDANERGWERIKKYCPDIIQELDTKIQEAHASGKLEKIESFEDIYNYFMKISEAINIMYSEFGIKKDAEIRQALCQENPDMSEGDVDEQVNEEAGKYVADKIKDDPLYEFFENIDAFRVGKKIDSLSARTFIKRVGEGIAQEKYKR